MRATVTIICSPVAGIILKVIATIRRQKNVQIIKQTSGRHNQQTRLDLILVGPKADLKSAVRNTKKIDGVFSIKPKPRTKPKDDILSIVIKAANDYPNIEDLLAAYKDGLDEGEKNERLYQLGIRVAELRNIETGPFDARLGLDELVKIRLMPDLAMLADAQFDEDGIKVMRSIFTKPKKKAEARSFFLGAFDHEVNKCDFLRGYLQGLVFQAGQFDSVKVHETFCRTEGQPYCLFELSQE
ncbi:MAG: hypothetical protein ACI9LU_002150 [Polaribacter sp.]|jgi:hypothetical protein